MTTTPETDLAAPYEPAPRPEDAQQPPAPESPQNALQVAPGGTSPAGFGSATAFELLQRQAKMMSKADSIPASYKDNVPNCAIALEIAFRVGCSPVMVAQNLDVIKGRPSWRAQYVIGAINSHPRFTSSLEYVYSGTEGKDDWSCYAKATRKDGVEVRGPKVSIAMAKAEGWYQKDGSKWKTMPELMLAYRAAAFFGRLNVPEILMGMLTVEEAEDVGPPKGSAKAELVSRFQPPETAPPCDHPDCDMVQKETGVPGEPPFLEECCIKCGTPWSQCQPKGGE